MEYKIEKTSDIKKLKEIEYYYGKIIDYSEGFFLIKSKYDRKDISTVKEIFNISDEEAHSVLDGWYSSHVDLYCFVDPITNKVLGPYQSAAPFSSGLASVNYAKEIIDHEGNKVLTVDEINEKRSSSSWFTQIFSFEDDIAVAKVFSDNKTNEYNVFMNKKGKIIHNGRYYDTAKSYSDDVAIVYKNFKECIADKMGNLRVNPLEQSLNYGIGFSEGLSSIYDTKTKKFGFADKNFNIVIPMEYDEVKEFSSGLCAVRKNNKWGYIDKEGTLKIPFIFADASSFKNGVAVVSRTVNKRVAEKVESALINTEGKVILDYTGNDIAIYNDVIVVNDTEYIPIKDMEISYGVNIRTGSGYVEKNFDSLEDRDLYFELAAKEIEKSNSQYEKKKLEIIKEIYSDLDEKLNELENSSLIKKHA